MERLQSIDTLRGITIIAMILVNSPGTWDHVYPPLLHAEWHGLTPTDLIFSTFLYIIGISIVLAYRKSKIHNKKKYKKISIRSLKIFGLGLLINFITPIFPFVEDLDNVRILGVLQRIGIIFCFSSFIFFNLNTKKIVIIIAVILIGYYLFTGFFILPNGCIPTFENSTENWVNFLDRHIIGSNHMWKPSHEPEGILSTLPSMTSSLLGILAGKILTSNHSVKNKGLQLIYFSIFLLISGYLWSIWFPINKTMWSSSYALVTAGWASLILSTIYFFNTFKKISTPKVSEYVSKNAIVIYFLSMVTTKFFYIIQIDDKQNIHSWIFNSIFLGINNLKLASLTYAIFVVAFYLFLAYLLYIKKIFIKI